jgi:hypothetical protein
MNDENKSIHDFDFNLICEYFSILERQGPGSPEVTVKALSFIDNLTERSRIADLGCGTGGQTMVMDSSMKLNYIPSIKSITATCFISGRRFK